MANTILILQTLFLTVSARILDYGSDQTIFSVCTVETRLEGSGLVEETGEDGQTGAVADPKIFVIVHSP